MLLFSNYSFVSDWSDCSCTFPVTGTWETSDHGLITFSNTAINDFPTSSFGTSVYTCETNIGDKYMAKYVNDGNAKSVF